jgi:hypothetical protein
MKRGVWHVSQGLKLGQDSLVFDSLVAVKLRGEDRECPAKPPQLAPRSRMGNQAAVFVLACDILTSHGWLDEGLGGVTGFKCRDKRCWD